MPMRRKERERVGPWTLLRRLGSGGNGEVWSASHDDGRTAAVKFLATRKTNSEPYQRFKDEVRVLTSLGERPGILPLLDSSLPDVPGPHDPPWFAMPEAEVIRVALGDAPELERVVEAVAEIADALASLVAEGISHRDVKPDNLYRYCNRYVVGDFGLVDFPNKAALTVRGRKLGPQYYIAPEMLQRPDCAEGAPADVYSLAKTLWVLATGQVFPPPGEQRLDVPGLLLSSYASHPRARLLDSLIERATRHSPDERPSMAEVKDDLSAWLEPPAGPISRPNLSDLRNRLERALAPAAAAVDRQRQWRELAVPTFGPLRTAIGLAHEAVRQAQLGDISDINDGANSGCWEFGRFGRHPDPSVSALGGWTRACFHVRLPALERAAIGAVRSGTTGTVPPRPSRLAQQLRRDSGTCSLPPSLHQPIAARSAYCRALLVRANHYLVAGVGQSVFSDGNVRMWACYAIWAEDADLPGLDRESQDTEIWSDSKLVPVGSAEGEQAATGLAAGFADHLHAACTKLIELARA